MKITKEEAWKKTRNILMTVAGSLILAFGIAVFLLPFNLVSGGTSGLAIIVEALLPFEFITVDIVNTCLTWILYILGFIVFGKESFGLRESLLKEHYETCIRIPMIGEARSLNLSNSVAIIVYEALRQNKFFELQEFGELTGRVD